MKKVTLTNSRKNSMLFLLSVFVLMLSSVSTVTAQELAAQDDDKFAMSVSLNSDAFFGF